MKHLKNSKMMIVQKGKDYPVILFYVPYCTPVKSNFVISFTL